MSTDNLFEQFKKLAKKHLGDPPEYTGEEVEESSFTIPGAEKVKNVVNDFIDITPLIERAGYQIVDLEIELGLIPKLIPHFKKTREVGDEEKAQVLEELKEKRLVSMLVNALFKSDNFQSGLNLKNYRYTGIEVEITALPAVRLKYKKILAEHSSSTEINIAPLEDK